MTKSRTRKAPGFLLARLVLYFVGAASAAFGVAGWIIPELPVQGDLPWAALVLAGLTGLSAFVVPVSCEIVGRSFWSVLLVPAALVFGGIGAYSFHHAVDSLIEEPRREAHADSLKPLANKLAAADLVVANHPVPVFPDTMGPKNIGARMDAWERAHKPLLEAQRLAKADLDNAPAYTPFVAPLSLLGVIVDPVWIFALAIDASLAFGLAGIGLVTGSIQKRIDANRPKRKPRAKSKKKIAPKKGFKPYVVASKT